MSKQFKKLFSFLLTAIMIMTSLNLSSFKSFAYLDNNSGLEIVCNNASSSGAKLTLSLDFLKSGKSDYLPTELGWFVRNSDSSYSETIYADKKSGQYSKGTYTKTITIPSTDTYYYRAFVKNDWTPNYYVQDPSTSSSAKTIKVTIPNDNSTTVTPIISSFSSNKSTYNTYEDITFSSSMSNTKSWIMYWVKNGVETTEEIARQNSSIVSYTAINGCNNTTYNGAVLYAYSGTSQSGTRSAAKKITFTIKQVDDSITVENLHDEPLFEGDTLKISSGTVKSANSNLSKVTVNIADSNGNEVTGVKNTIDNIGSKTYSLSGFSLPTQNLKVGNYFIRVWATNATNTVGIMYKEVKLTISSKQAVSTSKAVQIAIGEIGSTYSKYNTWNGKISNSYIYAWCATFTSWVYTNSDIPTTKTASCLNLWDFYVKNGNAKIRSSGYKPKAGDAIFFDWNGDGKGDPNMYEHVGIVEYIDENDIVHTIEGNSGSGTTSTRKVKRCERGNYKDNIEIIGYGVNGGTFTNTVISTPLNQNRWTNKTTNIYNQQSKSSVVNGTVPKDTKVLVTEIMTWSNGEKWAWVEFYESGLLKSGDGHFIDCNDLTDVSPDNDTALQDEYSPPICTTGTTTVNGDILTLRITIDTYGGDAKVNKIGWFVRKADSSTVYSEPTLTGTFSKLTDGGKEYTYTLKDVEPGEYIIRAYAETIYGRGQAENISSATIENNDNLNENDTANGILFYISNEKINANIGDEIIVPVKVKGNSGISDFGITLLYDSSILSPVGVDNGNGWSAELAANLNYGDGQIFISSSTNQNKTLNDILFEVTFKVLKTDVSSNFSLEIDEVHKLNSSNKLISANADVSSGTWIIGSENDIDFMIGDVNNDGKIDSGDATLVLLHYAKKKMLYNERTGDVNNDGKVDSGDATLILLHYAGLKLIGS